MPHAGIAQFQVEISQLKRVSLTRKGREGCETNFLSVLEHCTNICLGFTPPRPAELRHMETARNKGEKQGLPVAATWGMGVIVVNSDMFCRHTSRFHH